MKARTQNLLALGMLAAALVITALPAHSREGSFVLQHTGRMNRGAASPSVTVVPDSATGELIGLTGRMTIIIEGGRHAYDFEYSLPGRS